MNDAPGRSCPLRYRYGPAAIAAAPLRQAQTLYVIGGLYGNRFALDAIEALAACEASPATLCFNGDFNWFDVEDQDFADLNRRVLAHDALLGNVEAELDGQAGEAGCGCAYPDHVPDEVVTRSNRIHARLKQTAAAHPALRARIAALPMVARYQVGDLAIGVVHGDAHSLSGWDFDVQALQEPSRQSLLADLFDQAGVSVFACTHTCLPALQQVPAGQTPRCIINNGSAGMPNFRGSTQGLITRIATTPPPRPARYGMRIGQVHIDAMAVDFDAQAWQQHFLRAWPPGSDAYESYFERICQGPDFLPDQALSRSGQPSGNQTRSAGSSMSCNSL